MYARKLMFTVEPGNRSTMNELADQAYESMKSLKEFKSATFASDEPVGEYVVLSLWESKEAAEAAGEALAPVRQAMSDIVTGPPTVRLLAVYEPRT